MRCTLLPLYELEPISPSYSLYLIITEIDHGSSPYRRSSCDDLEGMTAGKNTMIARPSGLSRTQQDQLRKAEAGVTLNILLKAFHLGRLNHSIWYCVNTEEHGKNWTLAAALQCPFHDLSALWPDMRRILQTVMSSDVHMIERHHLSYMREPGSKSRSMWLWFSWDFFFAYKSDSTWWLPPLQTSRRRGEEQGTPKPPTPTNTPIDQLQVEAPSKRVRNHGRLCILKDLAQHTHPRCQPPGHNSLARVDGRILPQAGVSACHPS
jgi:hypothetical protein